MKPLSIGILGALEEIALCQSVREEAVSEVAGKGKLHARSVRRGVSAHALQGAVSWLRAAVFCVAFFRSPGGREGEAGET